MGIDPGLRATGVGIIEGERDSFHLVDWDVIRPLKSDPLPQQLVSIFNGIIEAIRRFSPQYVAIEDSFYHKNIRSAFTLGQVRGIAIVAAVSSGIPVKEYTPREVKLSVVGRGSASKDQVRFMVRTLLCIDELKVCNDISDALAVALCHSHRGDVTPRLK
jgi:crossover junction endodeoxyribonuclease RuvC